MKKARYFFACSIICALLCSCAIQSRIPSNTDPQASTHLIEKPSFPAETQPYREIDRWETIQTKLLEVISGANTFFSHDFEKTLTIDDYCSTYGMDDTVKITKYTIIDLDQDNVPEIVLGITENEQSDYGFLVLRFENGGVVGYDFTYRQMIDLKKDGTFGYLGGVADTGYARLNFTGNSWEYIKICNVTETADTVMFFCNGQAVSEEAYWETVAEQDSKEEVEWLTY